MPTSAGLCHGFANITHDTQSGETGLYLTVYDSQASGRALNFRLWQYSTGREIVLKPESAITFAKDAMLGSDTPVRFDGGEAFVQNFKLQEGWNWVSFNLKSDQLSDVNTLLGGMKWSDGDILTDLGSNLTLTYEAAQKQWIATDSTDTVTISPKNAYAIKVKKDCTLPVGGTVIKDQDDRTITVSKGWNAIGYTPMTNLSVETALSDYFDNAEPGDLMALFVNGEIRALAKPAVSVGGGTATGKFLMKAYGNETGSETVNMSLQYYSSTLKHLFTLTDNITLDAVKL